MGSQPTQPQLDEAQRALVVALEEACAVDLTNLDTRELIEIDETLDAASKAAKEALSMRLKLEGQAEPARKQPGADARASGGVAHRVFDDSGGKHWHAFAVQPSSITANRAGLPDSFRNGWLVFDSVDEARRVAPIPEGWVDLPIDRLRFLCEQAVSAPKRAGSMDRGRS
jgi:hypothetical protein